MTAVQVIMSPNADTDVDTGHRYLLTLMVDEMRAVRGFHLDKAAASVLTTCVSASHSAPPSLTHSILFVLTSFPHFFPLPSLPLFPSSSIPPSPYFLRPPSFPPFPYFFPRHTSLPVFPSSSLSLFSSSHLSRLLQLFSLSVNTFLLQFKLFFYLIYSTVPS